MSDRAAFELLTTLASLQRRHAGAAILLSSTRTAAWPDSAPDARTPIDPTVLRELAAQGLVMIEPYAETRPRGLQILGMTTKGWKLVSRLADAAAHRRPAA